VTPRPTGTRLKLVPVGRRNGEMNAPSGCSDHNILVALFGLSALAGPTTCANGWESPSIGPRGACSWHGGVDSGKTVLILVASAAAALFAGRIATGPGLTAEERDQCALAARFPAKPPRALAHSRTIS